jgi:hypothetical protein
MVVERSMRLIKPHGLFVSTALLPKPALPLPLELHTMALDPLGFLPPQL